MQKHDVRNARTAVGIASLAFVSSDPNYKLLPVLIAFGLLGLEIVLKVDFES